MAELLCLGFGYTAEAVAKRAMVEGWRVSGTTRSSEKQAALSKQGVTPIAWSAPDPVPADVLQRTDVIFVSVGPSREAGGRACPAAAAIPQGTIRADARLLYLSATGVYGDHNGAWIDEDTPAGLLTRRGERRLAAEAAWQDVASAAGASLFLCRLAGIYGPGRNAVESLKARTTRGASAGLAQRVIKPGQVFNRVHRDDIASGVMALLGGIPAEPVINFTDDLPSPPEEVIEYAASLLGVDPPPAVDFDIAELSPMARSFYADNKRLRNGRFRALLGGKLRYPTYKDGLDAIYASLNAPG